MSAPFHHFHHKRNIRSISKKRSDRDSVREVEQKAECKEFNSQSLELHDCMTE